MEVITKTLGSRSITVYKNDQAGVPVVYLVMYVPEGTDIIRQVQQETDLPFHLVTVQGLRWDQDLSPWPHDWVVAKDDDFTGQAPEFLGWLRNEAVMAVDGLIPGHDENIIGGYSMGGLFSLWSLFNTDVFQRAISASGSVWYPGFVQYFESTEFPAKPKSIYFSLGTRECRTPNKVVARVQTDTQALYENCEERGIPSIFAMGPGNHFQYVLERMAKGIAWTLKQRG